MTARPASAPPRGSRTAAPEGRDTTAGLRRGLVLLALVLTAVAGPLGRPSGEQALPDEVFQPVAFSSSAPAPAR